MSFGTLQTEPVAYVHINSVLYSFKINIKIVHLMRFLVIKVKGTERTQKITIKRIMNDRWRKGNEVK